MIMLINFRNGEKWMRYRELNIIKLIDCAMNLIPG